MDTIRAAVGQYPHTASLHEAPIALDEQTELIVEPLSNAQGFGPLLNELRYDVFEVPIVSFLVTPNNQGIPVVATPLFVTRRFHQSRLVLNHSTGVYDPADLAGRKAGIRYHGFTDGTWARRNSLARLRSSIRAASTLGHHLAGNSGWRTASGERQPCAWILTRRLAAQGANSLRLSWTCRASTPWSRDRARLPRPRAAEEAWFRSTGVVPINHLIAVQRRVLEDHPHLLEQLFEVFSDTRSGRDSENLLRFTRDRQRRGQPRSPADIPRRRPDAVRPRRQPRNARDDPRVRSRAAGSSRPHPTSPPSSRRRRHSSTEGSKDKTTRTPERLFACFHRDRAAERRRMPRQSSRLNMASIVGVRR